MGNLAKTSNRNKSNQFFSYSLARNKVHLFLTDPSCITLFLVLKLSTGSIRDRLGNGNLWLLSLMSTRPMILSNDLSSRLWCLEWVFHLTFPHESWLASLLLSSKFCLTSLPNGFLSLSWYTTGQPISLFLFLVCAKGLFGLTRHCVNYGLQRGIQICRDTPMIIHLLFADDNILIMEASPSWVSCLNGILKCDQELLGQELIL